MYNMCLNTYLNYKVDKFTRKNVSEELKETSLDSVNVITFTAKKKRSITNILQDLCKTCKHTFIMAIRFTNIDSLGYSL